MKTIDLREVKQVDILKMLDSFFWDMITKKVGHFQVITDGSDKTKEIVYQLCDDYGFEYDDDVNNGDSIIVFS